MAAGALTVAVLRPPCSLASGLEAFSSPGKSETENKGSKYFPFKLKLRESGVRTTRLRKYGKISLLPAPALPEVLEEREENLKARPMSHLGDTLSPT